LEPGLVNPEVQTEVLEYSALEVTVNLVSYCPVVLPTLCNKPQDSIILKHDEVRLAVLDALTLPKRINRSILELGLSASMASSPHPALAGNSGRLQALRTTAQAGRQHVIDLTPNPRFQ
jgi:hypothetical protein